MLRTLLVYHLAASLPRKDCCKAKDAHEALMIRIVCLVDLNLTVFHFLFTLSVHDSGVIGVHVTSVNRVLITVGCDDVKFWHFSTCKLIDSFALTSPPRFSRFHDERYGTVSGRFDDVQNPISSRF